VRNSRGRIFNSVDAGIRFCRQHNLDTVIKPSGVKNFLPSNSLTFTDFERTDTELEARVYSIADNIGRDKILSRITTNIAVLRIPGAEHLGHWWAKSTAEQKFVLLSQTKRQGKVHPYYARTGQLPESYRKAIDAVQCPFREPGAKMGYEEDGEHQGKKDPEGSSSSDKEEWSDGEE